jgi:hypothetical protein
MDRRKELRVRPRSPIRIAGKIGFVSGHAFSHAENAEIGSALAAGVEFLVYRRIISKRSCPMRQFIPPGI